MELCSLITIGIKFNEKVQDGAEFHSMEEIPVRNSSASEISASRNIDDATVYER